MTIEQLKALLESGAITQEQFDAMAKAIDPNYQPEPKVNDPEPKKDEGNDPEPDDIEKIIQRAVDRATNKLGNENKKLKAELDKTRKAKMTAEELQEVELKEKEDELAEREKQVKEYENRMYALKAIKKAGLDKGDETAMEVAEFVMGEDETAIDERVKTFKKLIDTIVKAEVEAAFKSGGRHPNKSGNGTDTSKNPYAEETFNLTEQMKLEATDPELAATLKAQAGK